MAGQPPDLANAELVEFEVQGKEGVTRIRIAEGATMEGRFIVNNVYRTGNDPTTGAPVYHINGQLLIRMVNFDKKLKKPVLKQPGPKGGTPTVGVT